jgi:SAM-dependent methyltransferase
VAIIFGAMAEFDHAVYWEERLAGSKGLEGVGYLGLGHAFNEWMYRVRRGVFRRTVSKHLTAVNGLSVLDIGSGTGEYLKLWKQLGAAKVTGSDLTATAVERLSAEFKDMEIRRIDISEPMANAVRYDAVSCMDVLFHVVDPLRFEQALMNIHASLVPGGYFFLSANFLHHVSAGQEHFKLRMLSDYEVSLAKAKFRIIERRPMFHLMNLPADSLSPLRHRWWSFVMRVCRTSYTLGGILGAILYPFETIFVRVRREGVSTEIMVCVAE